MTVQRCARQPEIVELLANGHWPHACPPALRAHLEDCKPCSELVLVTSAFQQSRAIAATQARLPAPGAIWWRAQLRRRNAAVERVAKPTLGAYVFALSVTLAVAIVLVAGQARHGFRWMQDLVQSQPAISHLPTSSSSALLSSGWSLAVVIPALATVALLGAVAIYLATEK